MHNNIDLYPFICNFPDLKIVLAHWGGGLPFYALMPEVKTALANTWFDCAATPFLYKPEIFEHLADIVGFDKILFGTDWYMSRLLCGLEKFCESYEQLLPDLYAKAAGENAVAFLKSDASKIFFPKFFATFLRR